MLGPRRGRSSSFADRKSPRQCSCEGIAHGPAPPPGCTPPVLGVLPVWAELRRTPPKTSPASPPRNCTRPHFPDPLARPFTGFAKPGYVGSNPIHAIGIIGEFVAEPESTPRAGCTLWGEHTQGCVPRGGGNRCQGVRSSAAEFGGVRRRTPLNGLATGGVDHECEGSARHGVPRSLPGRDLRPVRVTRERRLVVLLKAT